MPALERLPGYTEAAELLASFEGLSRYLAASGAEIQRGTPRGEAAAAILALLNDVFQSRATSSCFPTASAQHSSGSRAPRWQAPARSRLWQRSRA